MMARLMVAMIAALLFGGFAANLVPQPDTVQTVEARKTKKDRKDKKKRRENRRDKRENRRGKRMNRTQVLAFSYLDPGLTLPTFDPDGNANREKHRIEIVWQA